MKILSKPAGVFLAGLICLAATFAPRVPVTAAEPVEKRLNVVFFLADDLRPDGLHALGNPIVKSPNLDEMRRIITGWSFADEPQDLAPPRHDVNDCCPGAVDA